MWPAAKYVLTPEYDSSLEYMFEEANILNAAAYYAGEVTDFAEVGVKAVDDYTLQYIVDKPTPYLLSCLTYGSFMPAYGPQLEELGAEFATACEKMYYCGAFILSEFEPQVKHVFVKNPNNWDAEHVYIDRIEQIYNTEAATLAPTMALARRGGLRRPEQRHHRRLEGQPRGYRQPRPCRAGLQLFLLLQL